MPTRTYSRARFALGIFKHPGQAWLRLRELSRMLVAPALSKSIDIDNLPVVKLVPVTTDSTDKARLISVYAANPSPFVNGPKTMERLEQKLNDGLKYFLILNEADEVVGARAFNPATKLLMSTVTDFRFRGKGYQAAAGFEVVSVLADEGFREFRSAILKSNTRTQRSLEARGWTMEPDPENPDLLRGVYRVDG